MPDEPSNPEGSITMDRRDAVLLIGIDRPAKLNGFTPAMFRGLGDAFTAFERDARARAAVLFAHGAHFTAGLQLDLFAPMMRRGESLMPPELVDPLGLRAPLRSKPVVCAVQGICFTLGIELMLAQDIVVAADDCRFAQIEIKRGIIPTGGATFRFVERAGWGNAQRWLLTGEEFGSAEALRIGFVQEVVPAGKQVERAIEIAVAIAEQAPLAVKASLASSRRYFEKGPLGMKAEMDAVQRELAQTDDAQEGVRAFLERRKGRFAGS